MSRLVAMTSAISFLIALQFGPPAWAAEAALYRINTPNAQPIVLKKDHYSISLIRGWVSSKDNFFKALLSDKTKLIVQLKSESVFFDGEKNMFAVLLENADIKRDTDRPWGVNRFILYRLPGDAAAVVEVKLAVERQDRLKDLFEGIKLAEPPAVGIDMPAWLGYSTMVTAITSSLFGTAKSNYPFIWSGNVTLGDAVRNGIMYEHYMVLIAPQKDGDPFLVNLDASKLKYDEMAGQLQYDGNVVRDRSYAVLKVTKAEGYRIDQLMLDSKAPWAILAVNQFLTLRVSNLKEHEQIVALVTTIVDQLKTEIDLLKREHRFSAYDRAVALYTFANHANKTITGVCKEREISPCPKSEIDQFMSNVGTFFELPQYLFGEVPQIAIPLELLLRSLSLTTG